MNKKIFTDTGSMPRSLLRGTFIIFSLMFLAAACSQKTQQISPASNNSNSGKIISVTIELSTKKDGMTFFQNGSVVKVVAENMRNVGIKAQFAHSNNSNAVESLGEAVSLSSQPNTWALPLSQSLPYSSFWAEGIDVNGQTVKSQDLGPVFYDPPGSYADTQKYGFYIEYPKGFVLENDYNKVKSLGYIPACDESMAICAYIGEDIYPGTNFETAGVSINILKNLNTEAKCYNFNSPSNEAQSPAGDFTINNSIFKSASGDGGAAGHFDKVQVYRNFHNNNCYEIAQRIVATNIGNYPQGTVKQFNQDEVWQRLQGIVNSFKFVSLEKLPIPHIKSITPKQGKKGANVTIIGENLSGFEGDLDVIFERQDGKQIQLSDNSHNTSTAISVKVTEPCQPGEKVYGAYSGIESVCDYMELKPGVYKVFVKPWGQNSNVVSFTILP